MDPNAARELFRKYHDVIKDLWIEKQVCYNLIVDKGIITASELERGLEAAKRNPEYRQMADEVFAASGKLLAEFGADAAFEDHLLRPPSSDKQN
jgi:hypothetical protein